MKFFEKSKTKWIVSGVSFLLFLFLILLVKCADVKPVGPADTSIGLSGLNLGFHKVVGEHMLLYYLTQILGYMGLLFAGLFAAAGVVQWVRRKSLLKVDREVLCLGGLYVVLMAFYLFFEKVVVNFRPILEKGQETPEASFPSSHTMLACVIFGSALFVLDKYISDPKTLKIAKILLYTLICVSVIGRLFCGVHWLTDILGGVLLSISLVFAFAGCLDRYRK